ncbi:MAG: M24 family metallopeptidase [Gemmataceae bacterium]|nr:M24 family metallopeptidase [Gemmataceae bacterium]
MADVAAIQEAIRKQGLDGWLLYDFRGQNALAKSVAGIDRGKFLSRRWFYFIPANGEPKKLVHRIEPAALEHLPGSTRQYSRWQELEAGVGELVHGTTRVAMEYVPRNANPYVSRVDAGTVELVRSFGVEVCPSGDLVQAFEAVWTDEQWAMHQESAKLTRAAFDVAFGFIADRIARDGSVHELEVQDRILRHFQDNGLTANHAPIVGVGPHSGDPHYEPRPGDAGIIRRDNFVLVDLWAKLDKPRAVYSDYTRVAFTGSIVPERMTQVFDIVAAARDAGIRKVQDSFASGKSLQGWEVDQATRDVIEKAGFGEYFTHRTGHSIGEETHGNGANMDDFETREERRVLPRTCFSIEPGIYLPEFGVRSEVNVYIGSDNSVHVTGGAPQTEIFRIVV